MSNTSSHMSKGKKSNIRVCVRVRPILPSDSHSPSSGNNNGKRIGLVPNLGGTTSSSHRRRTFASTPSTSFVASPPALAIDSNVIDDSMSVSSHCTSTTAKPSLTSVWKVHPDQATLSPNTGAQPNVNINSMNSNSNSYTVDAAYGPNSTTKELYDSCVKDLVRGAVVDGYHTSILAYGQTNTGKTFTMIGTSIMSSSKRNLLSESPSSPSSLSSSDGILQMAICDVFRFIHEDCGTNREFLLRVSFIEIYNETIYDLLSPTANQASSASTGSPTNTVSNNANNSSYYTSNNISSSNNNIRIFESKSEGVIIRGLHEEIATTPEQVLSLLHRGQRKRQMGATGMNANSSRSHAVFRIVVESSVSASVASNSYSCNGQATAITGLGVTRISSLSLVDLAGSECVKQTIGTSSTIYSSVGTVDYNNIVTMGMRQKEGQYINKSLLTLGHVIYKLSEINNRHVSGGDDSSFLGGSMITHIPYRDSKLTRILQPSLSGNAQVCIICNISPLIQNMDESHNTLKFALRAKRIRQHATVHEVVDEKTLLQNYRDEINDLKNQLREAQAAQIELERLKMNHSPQPIAKSDFTDGSRLSQQLVQSHVDSHVGADRTTSIGTHHEGTDDETPEVLVLTEVIKNLEKLIIKSSSMQRKEVSSNHSNPSATFSQDDTHCNKKVIVDGIESLIQSYDNPFLQAEHSSHAENDRNLLDINIGKDNNNADYFLRNLPDESNSEYDCNSLPQDSNVECDFTSPARQKKLEHRFILPADVSGSISMRPSVIKRRSQSGDDASLTSSEESSTESHSFISELHRIQSLVGSVLKRVEMTSTSSKASAVRHPPDFLTASPFQTEHQHGEGTNRDDELERLRAQLEEQTMVTNVRKADSSFLQFQLQQKDALLAEVSSILEAVEERQIQLERENSRMKQEWVRTMALLKARESDIAFLQQSIASHVNNAVPSRESPPTIGASDSN